MNIDRILETFNRHKVAYLLLGGVNFLLRHKPVLTVDIDLWIEDTPENLGRCESALGELQAEWGESDSDWAPVAGRPRGWLARQTVFCLTSPSGAIDVFRAVKGLPSWAACRSRALPETTPAGTPYVALCDDDMLQCQMALPEQERKLDRIRTLRKHLDRRNHE